MLVSWFESKIKSRGVRKGKVNFWLDLVNRRVVPENLVTAAVIDEHYGPASANCSSGNALDLHFSVELDAGDSIDLAAGVTVPRVKPKRRFR